MAGASLPELERTFRIGERTLTNALFGRKPYDQVTDPALVGSVRLQETAQSHGPETGVRKGKKGAMRG